MQTVFYYPPASKIGYENPYSINYKRTLEKYFILFDSKNQPALMQALPLLRFSFSADIFIFNWLETIAYNRFGAIQFFLAILALLVIRVRKARVIWMFHNIHPHQGENVFSKIIQRILFKHADKIITHSVDACSYAQKRAQGLVVFACHPVPSVFFKERASNELSDVFIWGNIFPYKGVVEFLEALKQNRLGNITVKILGYCKNQELASKIRSYCNDFICFDNRKPDFEEIATCVKHSKYVLFPYVGENISSSGALIDTLIMGGTPIGPNKGAFKDLSCENMCAVYNTYSELFEMIKSEDCRISEESRQKFIKENSWDSFVKKHICT